MTDTNPETLGLPDTNFDLLDSRRHCSRILVVPFITPFPFLSLECKRTMGVWGSSWMALVGISTELGVFDAARIKTHVT